VQVPVGREKMDFKGHVNNAAYFRSPHRVLSADRLVRVRTENGDQADLGGHTSRFSSRPCLVPGIAALHFRTSHRQPFAPIPDELRWRITALDDPVKDDG